MNWIYESPSLLMNFITVLVIYGIIMLAVFTLKKFGVNIRAFWLQGITNAFFASILLCIAAGTIAMIPVLGFHKTIYNGFAISAIVIWVAIFCWFFLNLISLNNKAGRELLDVAPAPNNWLFIMMGIFCLAVGLSGFLDISWENSEYSWIVPAIFGLSGGIFYVFLGISRLQIRENGILIYIDLVKWHKIEAYEWIEDNGKSCSLKLRLKNKLPAILRSSVLHIPIEQKPQFEWLLKWFLKK